MKQTKPSKSNAHQNVAKSPEPVEYIDSRRASLQRVLKARAGAESALDKAIAESKAGRTMLTERKRLAEVLQKAYRRLREGKETRLRIVAEHGKALQAFHKKYRRTAEEAWLRVAEDSPSAYQIYRAFHDVERPPSVLDVKILYFLGFIFRYEAEPSTVPGDTASTGQALGMVPPLDQSASGISFSLKIVEEHADVWGWTLTTVYGGSMFAAFAQIGTATLIPGAAWSRALVGEQFNFPPGYTQFSVSADIDWEYDLSTFVFVGGADCGANLVMRVEPAAGSAPVEQSQPLASLVAPVIWGAGQNGSGSSSIGLSLELAGPSALSLKVFAGGFSHAEGEGVSGGSSGAVWGTLRSISVHAE